MTLTDIRTGDWRHGRAINVVVDGSLGILVHVLGFEVTLLGRLCVVDAHASGSSTTSVDAFDEAFSRFYPDIFAMSLHVAEELEFGARGCDASVTVQHRTRERVVGKRATVLTATSPLVAFGTTTTRWWGAASCNEGLLGIATAGAGGIGRI
jgi:hypothetical protein